MEGLSHTMDEEHGEQGYTVSSLHTTLFPPEPTGGPVSYVRLQERERETVGLHHLQWYRKRNEWNPERERQDQETHSPLLHEEDVHMIERAYDIMVYACDRNTHIHTFLTPLGAERMTGEHHVIHSARSAAEEGIIIFIVLPAHTSSCLGSFASLSPLLSSFQISSGYLVS